MVAIGHGHMATLATMATVSGSAEGRRRAMPDTPTDALTVPADLIDLELTHRALKAKHRADIATYGPGACGYAAYLAGQRVAHHPWLTQHPGTSPQRRAARAALRRAADAAVAA